MTQQRKTKNPSVTRRSGPDPAATDGARPLSARSIIASTLLGVTPPSLPSQMLVRSGGVFGITEGTTRVALSRMVAAGELELGDGSYRLAGHLLDRQERQSASRRAQHRSWDGDWELAVVIAERRDAASRAALREAMRGLKLAELREGVWTRPDNLDPDRFPESSRVVAAQCQRFIGRPEARAAGRVDPAMLWDLDGWSGIAADLRSQLAAALPSLEAESTEALAPAFVLSATVLRHLLADPELPDELLPPTWPGAALRDEYDVFDATFKRLWRDWFRSQR